MRTRNGRRREGGKKRWGRKRRLRMQQQQQQGGGLGVQSAAGDGVPGSVLTWPVDGININVSVTRPW